MKMCIKVLFIRNQNQVKFPSICKWMNTVWCYAAVQSTELDLYVLKRIKVSEINFRNIHTV